MTAVHKERRLCKDCQIRWAQDRGYCVRCGHANPPEDIRPKHLRIPRRVYTPPERAPVVLKDPWTGEVREYEIVFDGR